MGNNSILFIVCTNWVHRICSGVIGGLSNVLDFIYSLYMGSESLELRVKSTDTGNESLHVLIDFGSWMI